MSGLYLHIPFCRQACSYCDFYFVTRDHLIPAFLNNMSDEFRQFHPLFRDREIQTVYLGGGTPSRLRSEQLEWLITELASWYDLTKVVEFTIEVNPEDLNRDYLKALLEIGFNRMSIGVQSLRPELLTFMHRAHSAHQALQALEEVASSGFDTICADLIYGCPDQSLDDIYRDIEQLLRFDIQHLSAYSLTIEQKTRLGKMLSLGRIRPVSDETVLQQAQLIRKTFARHGYNQYEVSNFSLPGKKAIHNTAYWTHQDYLGFGPSAHTFIWPSGSRRAWRWANPRDLRQWSSQLENPGSGFLSSDLNSELSVSGLETLDLMTLARERIMMGLRTCSGVSLKELRDRYDFRLSDQALQHVDSYREKGWMKPDDPLRLTAKGMDLSDAIVLRLI